MPTPFTFTRTGANYFVTMVVVILSDVKTYMLFAGWEACVVKICDRGLENAAWGRSEGSIFKPKVTVLHHTDPP